MRCSKDRPYENRNFCSQSEIQDMEGSQVILSRVIKRLVILAI